MAFPKLNLGNLGTWVGILGVRCRNGDWRSLQAKSQCCQACQGSIFSAVGAGCPLIGCHSQLWRDKDAAASILRTAQAADQAPATIAYTVSGASANIQTSLPTASPTATVLSPDDNLALPLLLSMIAPRRLLRIAC